MCKLILLNGYWNDWGEFPVKNKQTNKQLITFLNIISQGVLCSYTEWESKYNFARLKQMIMTTFYLIYT